MKLDNIKKNIGIYVTIVAAFATVSVGGLTVKNNIDTANKKTNKTVATYTAPTTEATNTPAVTTPTTTDKAPATTNTSTSTNAAPATSSSTTTTSQAPVTTTQTVAQQPTTSAPKIESRLDKDLKTAIPNNGKYTITFDKTEGVAGTNIKFTVNGVTPQDNFWTIVSDGTKEISEGSSNGRPSNNIYEGEVSINASKGMATSLICYVFITSSVDGKTYYQTSPYKVTSINIP